MSLDYEIASQAFAFLGNSLLAPMSQTSPAGLLPEFWEEFPDFDNKEVGDAIEGCLEFAREAHRREGAGHARDGRSGYPATSPTPRTGSGWWPPP